MARQTKRGICELCGAHTNVGMNHGSKACPACTHVQTALNKRPEAVAKAIRAMGKTEEMLGHLIPAGGLAVKVTAELLQEISGIVGYDGEDPSELVEAVRRMALRDASSDCADCTALRGDLLRACGLEMDDTEDGGGWDVAVAAAVQTIAMDTRAIDEALGAASWYEDKYIDGAAREEEEREISEALRAKLTLAEQSRDEWEQRAVQAESNVETLEAELASKEDEAKEFMRWASGKIGEMRVPDQLLFDLASIAVSAGGDVAHMALEKLIDAARRAV